MEVYRSIQWLSVKIRFASFVLKMDAKKNVLRMKMQNKINTNNGPSEGLYCSCAHFYMIITVTRLCELKRKVAKITKNTKPSQFHLVPAYSIVSVLV